MANVLTVVWFVILYVTAQTAIMVWASFMLPNPVERARQRAERKPVLHFFLGALFWAMTLVVITLFVKEGNPGPVQLIGWSLAGPMLAGSVVGGAAFAQLVAERIRSRAPSVGLVPSVVGGALMTALAGLLPIIGWLVFLPITGFISVGAGMLGIFSKREVAKPVEQAVPATASSTIVYAEQSAQQG